MAQEKAISNTEPSTYSFLCFNGTFFASKIMLHLVPAGHGAELHPYPVLMVMIRKITVVAKTLTLHMQTTGSHYLMNYIYVTYLKS